MNRFRWAWLLVAATAWLPSTFAAEDAQGQHWIASDSYTPPPFLPALLPTKTQFVKSPEQAPAPSSLALLPCKTQFNTDA